VRGLGRIGVATVVLAACRDTVAHVTAPFPVSFVVANALEAPVTVAVDGVPSIILIGGRSGTLTVPSNARLTWTSAKPTDPDGQPIPDDIGEVRLPAPSAGVTMEIINVIDGQPYITASIVNRTRARVSIGVSSGAAVACAAVLPAASDSTLGFVRIGYYRLQAGTEVRAYRDPARCTGTYVPWPASRLAGYVAKSGLVTLSLDAPP